MFSVKEFRKKDVWGANGDEGSETGMAVGCSDRASLFVTSAVVSCVVVLVVVTTVGDCSLQPEKIKQADTVTTRYLNMGSGSLGEVGAQVVLPTCIATNPIVSSCVDSLASLGLVEVTQFSIQ